MDKILNLKEIFSVHILPWLYTSGLKIAVIIVVAFILNKILKVSIEKIVRKIIVSSRFSSKKSEKQREDTLIKIINNIISIIIVVIAGIMILQSLGIPVGPVLAAAGVAGLALGFGGQYLIRDIINGLFIILENQYRVGDIIRINDTYGLVENVTIRITTFRDMDGTVHYIPNGEIKMVSNLSKSYSRINFNIGIGYSSDLEKVKKVINKVGDELAQDLAWKDLIKKPPQFLRVDNFGDSSIDIRILGETQPGKQWEVAGEFRFRIKIAFDKEGIEIPFPQRVIHQA